ncbi:hypothetical protein C0J45_9954 [Silurus meridionalis]|nr:hypothetical protein C0J45_9954 [Silurus meridionalis]
MMIISVLHFTTQNVKLLYLVGVGVLRLHAILNQIRTEGRIALLHCLHDGKVVWSKSADRGRVDILTAQHGEDVPYITHSPNLDPRYAVVGNLSLLISSVSLSDSGIYYCNSVPVINLTVTPSQSRLCPLPEDEDSAHRLDSIAEIQIESQKMLDTLRKEDFQDTFQKNTGRRCITVQGDYFEDERPLPYADLEEAEDRRSSHELTAMWVVALAALLLHGSVHTAQSDFISKTFTEGSSAFLYCGNKSSVMWFKGVKEGRRPIIFAERGVATMKHIPDADHRFSVLSDLSLHIKNVSLSDSGIYYCNIEHVFIMIITPVQTGSFRESGSMTATEGGVAGGFLDFGKAERDPRWSHIPGGDSEPNDAFSGDLGRNNALSGGPEQSAVLGGDRRLSDVLGEDRRQRETLLAENRDGCPL